MALIGITFVVFSLAVIVTVKGASLKDKELEYQIREENLTAQRDKELERSKDVYKRQLHGCAAIQSRVSLPSSTS